MKHCIQSTFFLFLLIFLLPQIPLFAVDETGGKKHTELNDPIKLPPSLEEELSTPVIPEDNRFMSDFLQMLFTLTLLISLLLFVSWFLKRMMRTRVEQLNTASAVKVIEQRQLSARSNIYLIEIEGRTFALGESHSNICLIGEFPTEISHETELSRS